MVLVAEQRMKELLGPFLIESDVPHDLYAQLCTYLELLVRWNERTNLTAVREPEAIVLRHFGESLFLGRHLPPAATLLDYGSGAGFPGLPIQLLLPGLKVTLAESQGKKASFLREAIRALQLDTEVWRGRVEAMPREQRFDVVALRAVDKMNEALKTASLRVAPGGTLALFVVGPGDGTLIPGTQNRMIRLVR